MIINIPVTTQTTFNMLNPGDQLRFLSSKKAEGYSGVRVTKVVDKKDFQVNLTLSGEGLEDVTYTDRVKDIDQLANLVVALRGLEAKMADVIAGKALTRRGPKTNAEKAAIEVERIRTEGQSASVQA